MLWQDWVLASGSIIFVIALFPSVLSKDKPAFSTSLTNGIVLIVFAFTQATLSLWLAAVATIFTSLLWLTLAVQKYHLDKKSSKT